jgi:hypothetical protein
MGFANTAVPMGVLGLIWNPAFLGMQAPDGRPEAWTAAAGFSALDSSNTGVPILRYDLTKALDSGEDPIHRGLSNRGVAAARFMNAGGGTLYSRVVTDLSSRDTLKFLRDRDDTFTDPSYSLDRTTLDRQVSDLVVGYGMPLPFGTIPVYIGANLKYHLGFSYSRTVLQGDFAPGTGTSGGFRYDRFSSVSGLGLSTDFGFYGKLSDALHVGMMFENLRSDFNWEATRRSYALDPTTGAETPTGPAQTVNLQEPFPYSVKLGLSAAPEGKNIVLAVEVEWKEGETRWRGGLERYYPEVGMVVRMGTYADEVSGEQIWCFGGGILGKNFVLDAAFTTRSLPAVQDSIQLGAAANASMRF